MKKGRKEIANKNMSVRKTGLDDNINKRLNIAIDTVNWEKKGIKKSRKTFDNNEEMKKRNSK